MSQTLTQSTNRRTVSANPASRYATVAVICGLLMAAAYIPDAYGLHIPVAAFLSLHIALEMSSIVVCFAVFVTGWFGYKQTKNPRDLVIGITFAATGAVDFVHTLSYKGMPDFLGTNTPGRAAAFWLLARMIVGLGLIAASLASSQGRSRPKLPILLVLGVGTVVFVSCVLIVVYGDAVGTALYPAVGRPPSALKAFLEYAIIGTYIIAFQLLSERRGWEVRVRRSLRSALIFAIVAEVAFTLYLSPYAWVNALGHVFKTVAYALILKALFVSAVRRPYEELAMARDELQALYQDAQRYREEMERSFARVGSALSSSLELEEALELISQLAEETLHVDCAVVLSMDGEKAGVASQRGLCHNLDRPAEVTFMLGERVLAEGTSLVVNDVENTGWVNCDFSDPTCLRSAACVPMIYEGKPLGVLAVYSYRKFAFKERDVKLLEVFASHAAVAIHNAMSFQRESRIADILQRTFLSTSPLSTDRFEIAQVYEPAMDEALVGGDFHDVYETSDGKIALVIGDVSGKGLKAAVHTAMVKFSLRAYLSEGHLPQDALRLLNRAIARAVEKDSFITLFVGILDTQTGELVYANAGHDPPLYACSETLLTLPATGLPLGVDSEADYESGKIELRTGCVLLLYTDGVSEARNGDSVLGIEGISKELIACRELSGEEIVRYVHHRAVEFAGGKLKDDVAILAVRAVR